MILGDELLGQDTLRELEGALESAILDFLIEEIEFFCGMDEFALAPDRQHVAHGVDFHILGLDARQGHAADVLLCIFVQIRLNGREEIEPLFNNEIPLPDRLITQNAVENLIEITTKIKEIQKERITPNKIGHGKSPLKSLYREPHVPKGSENRIESAAGDSMPGSIEPVRRTTGRFIQAVRLAAGSAGE